jgi:hypothetical protein
VAAVYFLLGNFRALDNPVAARKTLWWGIAFNIALVAVMSFLPTRFPNYVIPLAYSWAARGISQSKQLSKEAIASSTQFTFHSNWRVVALGVLFLVGTLILWFCMFYALVFLHIGNLA